MIQTEQRMSYSTVITVIMATEVQSHRETINSSNEKTLEVLSKNED